MLGIRVRLEHMGAVVVAMWRNWIWTLWLRVKEKNGNLNAFTRFSDC